MIQNLYENNLVFIRRFRFFIYNNSIYIVIYKHHLITDNTLHLYVIICSG